MDSSTQTENAILLHFILAEREMFEPGPHHEPVVHANLSETGSDRADVLFRKPGFEEFYSKAG